MPHYRDGDDQKPLAFIGLIEEVILPADYVEAIPAQFCFHYRGVDCMFGIYGLRSAIGNDQTPSVRQRISQMREYNAGTSQFVISIRDEHGIHRSGNVRIIRFAADNPDVLDARAVCADPQKRQRQTQYIDGLHISASANGGRKFQRKVSGAASEIHNPAAIAEIQLSDDLRRTLPGIALMLH